MTQPTPVHGFEPVQPSLDRVYYYHGDHLNSSTYATDNNGRPVTYYDYLPFGEVAVEHNQTTNFNNGYKFNAKELDKATGMSYYGARYYDSRLSIFVSVDPMAEETMTPYQYCSNNPINRIDPDGRWDIEVHAYKNRSISGYALLIMKDNNGQEVYRTVVKTIGYKGRNRSKSLSDTPQGKYKILGWRKTGKGTSYDRTIYGPNDLLALNYLEGEGGGRNGMHIHGGRQEGKYIERKDLMSTGGCMRINDYDLLEMKAIATELEKNNSKEKPGVLNVVDDLIKPIRYDENRHSVGEDQFPIYRDEQAKLLKELEILKKSRAYNPKYVKKRTNEILNILNNYN